MVVQENQPGPSGREEKILVSVRLRPLNEKELAKNDASDWECINGTSVIYRSHLSISERSMYPSAYTFDKVFGANCSTKQVYEEGAKEVALSVVRGVNASVFAYGQTSSGKTYTMSGITNHTITEIFEHIEKHKEREFILKFSAMEIYNESVRDLLSVDSTPLRLLDDPEKGTVVEKLTEETLRDWNHFKELLSVCEAQRQIGETALNEVSSRSHQILRLTIESTAREFLVKDKLSALTATVNFIDLAGSERASQSLSAGTRLKEGCHINRSLLTLGTVIRKLSKGKNGHIPFRDSKLTRILQSSLGGNARTAIICTMSPAKIHVEQSRNTLLFASCAKDVTTNAQVNVVMSDKALVKHLQNELARMESQLRSPARAMVSSDTDMLHRKKDIEIEKLKKEVMELTEQLVLARSQIEDLQRMVREEKASKEMEKPSSEKKRPTVVVALENQYPRLRVKRTWGEFNDPTPESPMSAQSSCKDEVVESSNISPRSAQHRHVSCDETLAEFTDLEDSFLNTRCSIQPSVGVIDEETEEQSYAQVEEIEEQRRAHEEQGDVPLHHASVETKGHSDGNSEDHCREVRCIEIERSSMNRCADSNTSERSSNRYKVSEIPECSPSQYEVSETQLPCTRVKLGTEAGNGGNRVIEVSGITVTRKEESDLSKTFSHCGILTSGKNSPQLPVKDITSNRSNIFHPNFVSPSPEKPSPWLLGKETPRFRGLMLLRSRSCKAGFMSQSSLSWFEQDENISSMMPNWFEKQAIDMPSSIQSTPSASQYNVNNASPNYLSRRKPTNQSEEDGACRSDGVQTKSAVLPYGFDSRRLSSSESQADVYEHEPNSVEDSNSETAKGFARMNESNESTSTHDKQIIHHPDEEMEMNPTSSIKSFRDVSLPWPLEFNRLQREILVLWHTCNVSLGHRTYFFLLFRGDEKDCVYLEVEHRRLSFIKESFSRGSRAIEDGRTLSPSSSMRALNRERYKLSQQMQKKLTKEERENLFLRWGISLNTKHRRLQLAHRLWSESKDMEHIQESASVVGKLLGIVDMNLASREMFGLNFTLRPKTKKPSRWKRSVLALSIL